MSRLVKLTHPADVPRLQHLLERCSDYFELHEGRATPSDAGECELTSLPPNATADDVTLLAFEDDDGALQGLVQLYRNYPTAGTWWIGLLVVEPELRSRGVGAQLLQCATDAVAAGGGTEIALTVSTNNPRGARFWDAAGFRDTGRVGPVAARNGFVDTVRLLSRPLSSHE